MNNILLNSTVVLHTSSIFEMTKGGLDSDFRLEFDCVVDKI